MTVNGIIGSFAACGILAAVELPSIDVFTRLGLGGLGIGALSYTLKHLITNHTNASIKVAESNSDAQLKAAAIHKEGLDNLSEVVDRMQDKLLDAAVKSCNTREK